MRFFKKKKREVDISFRSKPHLQAIKPKEKYVFHSDYFKIDDYYACIMSFFHEQGANDDFGPFWGINKIHKGLGFGVTTVNLDQVKKMSETWIRNHQTSAEHVSNMSSNENQSAGTLKAKKKQERSLNDLEIIASELNDGASYLQVHSRLLVKAPSLEELDDAVSKIERSYTDLFGTLWASTYTGEQRTELSTIFSYNKSKKGKGFYFTSTEYAGSYHLVTHGLEDSDGEYIGYMIGDVNNSAVLFNTNRYDHHVVVASDQVNEKRGRAKIIDMWGSKLSQSCMLHNHRVVHIILNGANLDELGPKFKKLTSKIDMNKGDLNMFELFGSHEEELNVFPAHMQKLILMAEQAYETTDDDRSIIRGSLEQIATKFYIDNRMWVENAKENRERLRIVGIPHTQVPRLEMFVTYLETRRKAMINASVRDDEELHALTVLTMTFKNMLSNNGDLFNTITNDFIDLAKEKMRVIYDFSGLLRRGKGIAMAQLVNVIGYSIDHLGKDDLVVIHGVEHIDDSVRPYLTMQLERLFLAGGRVCYLYGDIEKMLNDRAFNRFDRADYTVYGTMSTPVVEEYQAKLGQVIPADLVKLITEKSQEICYIRRGVDNVVFHQDLKLDPDVDGVLKRKRVNNG